MTRGDMEPSVPAAPSQKRAHEGSHDESPAKRSSRSGDSGGQAPEEGEIDEHSIDEHSGAGGREAESWMYIDRQGEQQGPFTTEQIKGWG